TTTGGFGIFARGLDHGARVLVSMAAARRPTTSANGVTGSWVEVWGPPMNRSVMRQSAASRLSSVLEASASSISSIRFGDGVMIAGIPCTGRMDLRNKE